MEKIERVFLIVLDSVGIGELPDAADYGDKGANTLANMADEIAGLSLENLEKMGLGKIHPIKGIDADIAASGSYGKMAAKSSGKDTTT
ncbi:MAG: phosphopentomutase, partial [Bacillota bacterium]